MLPLRVPPASARHRPDPPGLALQLRAPPESAHHHPDPPWWTSLASMMRKSFPVPVPPGKSGPTGQPRGGPMLVPWPCRERWRQSAKTAECLRKTIWRATSPPRMRTPPITIRNFAHPPHYLTSPHYLPEEQFVLFFDRVKCLKW